MHQTGFVHLCQIQKGTMRTSLILNADDLGYTRGINHAIGRCSAAGALRSATLMANGAAFEDACSMIRNGQQHGGGPAVGAHLVLTELRSLSPPGEIPGLVDEEGFLPASPGKLMSAILQGRVTELNIRKELHRQVARIVDSGLRPTHLDSHKHVHVLPLVLDAVIDVARKHSIQWIRSPFETIRVGGLIETVHPSRRSTFFKQHLRACSMSLCRPQFTSRVRQAGLRTPDHFCGISLTGVWSEQAMVHLLERLPEGINEWMFHPGDCDSELMTQRTRLSTQRQEERDLLLSPILRETAAGRGIAFTSYGEMIP